MEIEQSQAQERQFPRQYGFEFTGDGFEYFKIWIVNICLTLLTLGIYSAWAKVRTHRYFYGNTRVAGACFDYLARPLQILKGRVIAAGALVLYSVLAESSPDMAAVMGLAFYILLPFIVVKALAFRARYSAYRNIRFYFDQDYGQAVKVYILLPFLMVFTLGLLYPFLKHRMNRFVVNNSAYGKTFFVMRAAADEFYLIYFKGFLLFIGAAVVAGILFGMASQIDALKGSQFLGSIAMAGAYFVAFAYISTQVTNLVFSTTSLGEDSTYRLSSDLDVLHMAWLYFSNTVGIVLTLGLFIPWAKVRMAQYRASRLWLQAEADLDRFVAVEQENTSAIGEEIGEVFDVEIGI